MKTTLVLDDAIVMRLKGEAARRGRSMSDLVEEALHLLFRNALVVRSELPPLPSFDSGGQLVQSSDRDALHGATEGR